MMVILLLLALLADLHAQWKQTGWREQSSYISLHKASSGTFARTWDPLNGGGTFYTPDSGETWTRIYASDSSVEILSIVSVGNEILAGTWDGLYRYSGSRSAWREVTQTGIPLETAIWSLGMISGYLYAGTETAVYVSGDSGSTWAKSLFGLRENDRVTSLFGYGDTVFAGTDVSGIHRTASHGIMWRDVSSELDDAQIHQFYGKSGMLFAKTMSGLFISENHGTDWVRSEKNLEGTNCILAMGQFLIAGTDRNGVLRSEDRGATWTPANEGLPEGCRVWSMVRSDDNLFAATDSGIWTIPYSRIGITNKKIIKNQPFALRISSVRRRVSSVQFDLLHSTGVGINVYNLTGTRCVSIESKIYQAGSRTCILPMDSFVSGLYILQLITEKNVYRRVFTLQ